MANIRSKAKKPRTETDGRNGKIFYLDFLTPAQKLAYSVYQENDIIFLVGPAGTGKTHLAVGFALQEMLASTKERLVLTRPIVEAGESLGFLPGTFNEKVDPYMTPLYDCLSKMVGRDGPQRQFIEENTEVAPLAYMRGRTMENCVCVLDEAQNCSFEQLVLFMTRMGTNSKMIITGDPMQSDLFASGQVPLSKMIESVGMVEGIGVVEFPEKYIVRHPLVSRLLKKLRELKEQREGGTPPPPREQAFGEGIEPAPVGPYAIRPE